MRTITYIGRERIVRPMLELGLSTPRRMMLDLKGSVLGVKHKVYISIAE